MSASDAAPLPRLGEVFFDVRGDSRTMRLSWYADTGIAVFSIWQGGRCTGTFRLPMDDLARMTEILQRGPERRPARARPEYENRDRAGVGYDGPGYDEHQRDDAGYDEHRYGEGQRDDAGYDEYRYGDGQRDDAGYDEHRYGDGQHGAASYDEHPYDEHSYNEHRYDERNRAGARGAGEYGADEYGTGEYGADKYGAGEYGAGGAYGAGEHALSGGYPDRPGANRPSADYADSAGYERSAGYADSAAGADASDATGFFELPTRAVRRGDGSYPRTAADHDGSMATENSGYGQQRFVPPYVRSGGEAYPNENPAAGSARRSRAVGPAYPADRAGISAEPERSWQPPQPEAGYSGGPEYPPAAVPAATAQYSAGRHSGQRARSAAPDPIAEPELGPAGEPFSERDYWSRQAR